MNKEIHLASCQRFLEALELARFWLFLSLEVFFVLIKWNNGCGLTLGKNVEGLIISEALL